MARRSAFQNFHPMRSAMMSAALVVAMQFRSGVLKKCDAIEAVSGRSAVVGRLDRRASSGKRCSDWCPHRRGQIVLVFELIRLAKHARKIDRDHGRRTRYSADAKRARTGLRIGPSGKFLCIRWAITVAVVVRQSRGGGAEIFRFPPIGQAIGVRCRRDSVCKACRRSC